MEGFISFKEENENEQTILQELKGNIKMLIY